MNVENIFLLDDIVSQSALADNDVTVNNTTELSDAEAALHEGFPLPSPSGVNDWAAFFSSTGHAEHEAPPPAFGEEFSSTVAAQNDMACLETNHLVPPACFPALQVSSKGVDDACLTAISDGLDTQSIEGSANEHGQQLLDSPRYSTLGYKLKARQRHKAADDEMPQKQFTSLDVPKIRKRSIVNLETSNVNRQRSQKRNIAYAQAPLQIEDTSPQFSSSIDIRKRPGLSAPQFQPDNVQLPFQYEPPPSSCAFPSQQESSYGFPLAFSSIVSSILNQVKTDRVTQQAPSFDVSASSEPCPNAIDPDEIERSTNKLKSFESRLAGNSNGKMTSPSCIQLAPQSKNASVNVQNLEIRPDNPKSFIQQENEGSELHKSISIRMPGLADLSFKATAGLLEGQDQATNERGAHLTFPCTRELGAARQASIKLSPQVHQNRCGSPSFVFGCDLLGNQMSMCGLSEKQDTAKAQMKRASSEESVPKTEEELLAFRKKQRRVKNRESVEKCRKKQRLRIKRLEEERAILMRENRILEQFLEDVRNKHAFGVAVDEQ